MTHPDRSTPNYEDLDGVRTWYEEHGDGEALVLLHPGGVDARAFGPNLGALAATLPRLRARAARARITPDVEDPITFEAMARDTI